LTVIIISSSETRSLLCVSGTGAGESLVQSTDWKVALRERGGDRRNALMLLA